jgi:glycosyltransferase involved in cell wall biosynthesis
MEFKTEVKELANGDKEVTMRPVQKPARGGTELMAERIASAVGAELLERAQITHSRVREQDENKEQLLVLHDLPLDPESAHLKDEGWNKFAKLFFVSHWQQAMYHSYLGVPYEAGLVVRNGVEPFGEFEKPNPLDDGEKIRLMYYSTPHRGLHILYHVFEQLAKDFPGRLELNVFSSFDLYGWDARDEQFKDLFEKLEEHPDINYSKSVSNERIREEIKRSHILAYPSTWKETSCLCLIEAMMGEMTCVHSSLGALPETSMGLTEMYNYSDDVQVHVNRFYSTMHHIISQYEDPLGCANLIAKGKRNRELAESIYSWNKIGPQWKMIVDALVNQQDDEN